MEGVASTVVHCIGHGLSSIATADLHTSAASSRLNWHPRRYKWTRPFRWKTKSSFYACTITFRFCSNLDVLNFSPGVGDSRVFWLECSTSGDKLRGQQIGRSLDAQLYCVVCVNWWYGTCSYSVDLPVEDIGYIYIFLPPYSCVRQVYKLQSSLLLGQSRIICSDFMNFKV